MTDVVAALVVLWVPGAVAARWLRISGDDFAARIGHQIALGIVTWPVLFLLTTSAGVVWNVWLARVAVAIFCLLLLWRARFRRPRMDVLGWATVGMFALTVWTRAMHVRDSVWPLWVDSVHHTMIIRLIVEQGTLPASYEPFISGSSFYYHWGFHCVVAVIAWISGATDAMAIPELLLRAGQVLNALIFFAVYAGAKALLVNRRAALFAAVLATLVSWFPAYYVSWGRYTQLAGLLILPPLVVAFWMLLRRPSARRIAAVALLGGGLVLVHVRVAFVFAVLAAILGGLAIAQRRWRGLSAAAAAGLLAVAVAGPWLLHVARSAPLRNVLAPGGAETTRWEIRNAAPPDLVWAPNQIPLYIIATGGLAALLPFREFGIGWRVVAVGLWLGLVLLLQRRRRAGSRYVLPKLVILAAWVGVVALLINLERFGLPRIRLLPNSAAIIMLFLPLAIAGAAVAGWIIDALVSSRSRTGAAVVVVALAAIAGASTMVRIINPVTILMTEDDRVALQWIREHIPAGARFGVGVQPWIGGAYVGVDGGYWISLATDRNSILPPGLYPWVIPSREADRVGEVLARWHAAQMGGDLSALDLLRAEGVTHVYFGAKNAFPIRRAFANAGAIPLYQHAGVAIYEIR